MALEESERLCVPVDRPDGMKGLTLTPPAMQRGKKVLLLVTGEGKAGIVVGVTSDLTQRFNAVELVRKGAEALGGKGGGGRPDMAQAGGPDGSRADAALDAIESAIGGG